MDGAALVVSVIALVVSGLSAFYAGQVARVERRRQHQERRPEFEARITDSDDGSSDFQLWVSLISAEAMDSVTVVLPDDCAFQFRAQSAGVVDSTRAESDTEGQVVEHEGLCWGIKLVSEHHRERQLIEVVARAGRDEWSRTVVVDVPYDVLSSV